MEAQGGNVTSRVLSAETIDAPARIAEHLHIDTETPILRVKRIRLVDDEPLALFTNYLIKDTGINEDDDFHGSIFKLLEDTYGVPIVSGEKIIEAMVAGSEEAEALDISVGDPVMLIRNITYDINGIVVDYAEGLYRADRYKYVVRLKR
jgi:GntR family transcriptional regulator